MIPVSFTSSDWPFFYIYQPLVNSHVGELNVLHEPNFVFQRMGKRLTYRLRAPVLKHRALCPDPFIFTTIPANLPLRSVWVCPVTVGFVVLETDIHTVVYRRKEIVVIGNDCRMSLRRTAHSLLVATHINVAALGNIRFSV